MGRHGLKYCMICNPDWNGMEGQEGTEAIGKYFLYPAPRQSTSGWIPVCVECADILPVHVVPLRSKRNHPYWIAKMEQEREKQQPRGKYIHDWDKCELVTQRDKDGLYNTWECRKCKYRVKYRLMGRPDELGCPLDAPAAQSNNSQSDGAGSDNMGVSP